MAYYLIYGCDQIYGGLHGMEQYEVVCCENDEEALEWARELSQWVIESYSNISDDLEETVQAICESEGIPYDGTSSEEDEIREQIYEEDMDYCAALLDKQKLPEAAFFDELQIYNDLLEELGKEEFERLYVLKYV